MCHVLRILAEKQQRVKYATTPIRETFFLALQAFEPNQRSTSRISPTDHLLQETNT
jgi:hypothetical protein